MTTTSTQGAGSQGRGIERLSLGALIAKNKRLSAGVAAVLVALVAAIVVGDLGSRVSKINDSTSCSHWSSANQAERSAYARLYVKEHGPLPSGAKDAGSVETAADNGCIEAFSFDEADTVDLVQAINHRY